MGYACPVCKTPQIDGEHLANHLAFTALLGDDAHEVWLDLHAPEWSSETPDTLADRIVAHAPDREFPQVFEDTVPDAETAHPHSEAMRTRQSDQATDADVAAVLERARELTARRLGSAEADDPDESAETETE